MVSASSFSRVVCRLVFVTYLLVDIVLIMLQEVYTADGIRKKIHTDGVTKTHFPDGTVETKYPNGSVRVKDKNGQVIKDIPADPNTNSK